jgi:hypothetical protein
MTSDSDFVTLGEAIEWIALCGEEPPTDEAELHRRWDSAQERLRELAEQGEIVARGQRQGGGLSEPIPAGAWAPTTTISPLYDSLTLRAPNGLPAKEPLYEGVRFGKRDLRKFWPKERASEPSAEILHHGFPGRPPLLRRVIEQEHERRLNDGEALKDATAEGSALREWAERKYPKADLPKASTITNNIRNQHRKVFPAPYRTKIE